MVENVKTNGLLVKITCKLDKTIIKCTNCDKPIQFAQPQYNVMGYPHDTWECAQITLVALENVQKLVKLHKPPTKPSKKGKKMAK